MKKPNFLTLLSKKLWADITASEDKQLQQAIKENDAYKDIANQLDEYFHDKNNTTLIAQQRLEKTWEVIDGAGESFQGKYDYTSATTSPLTQFLKIAAILIVLISAAALSYYAINTAPNARYTTLAANDSRVFKTLQDGTRIWLNLNSSLRYNEQFGETKREIFLSGEAFFDVTKNSKVPLIIHARNIDITVKGTAFNVNAYNDLSDIEVALIRGSVEVTHRFSKQKMVLKPHEKLLVADKSTGQPGIFRLINFHGKNPIDINWTNDSLVFKKEKLKDLAVQMEKKYSVQIDIRDEQLKNKRFSGTFADESIDEALEALKLSYPFSYSINDKLIIIDK